MNPQESAGTLCWFVARLEEWRTQLQMSDRKFSRDVLGIDHTTWNRIKRGVEPANAKFVGRIVLRHPFVARYLEQPREERGA